MTLFALSTQPIDLALIGAAVLLLVIAAKTYLSGKGQAQMGLGFMLMAAVVWTFAIGRQIADFSALDGVRIAGGVVLLVPAFRVLFSNRGGGATTAVVSLLLAAVVAGPVISKAFPDRKAKVENQLEATKSELQAQRDLYQVLISKIATQREVVESFNLGTTDDVRGNVDAMVEVKRFSELDAEADAAEESIRELEQEITALESSLASLANEDLTDSAAKRIDDTLRRIDEAAEKRDGKSALDAYADDARALELFDKQFGESAPKAPVEIPVETPVENPVETSVETSIDAPIESPGDSPADPPK